jgi:hypothetical protein
MSEYSFVMMNIQQFFSIISIVLNNNILYFSNYLKHEYELRFSSTSLYFAQLHYFFE